MAAAEGGGRTVLHPVMLILKQELARDCFCDIRDCDASVTLSHAPQTHIFSDSFSGYKHQITQTHHAQCLHLGSVLHDAYYCYTLLAPRESVNLFPAPQGGTPLSDRQAVHFQSTELPHVDSGLLKAWLQVEFYFLVFELHLSFLPRKSRPNM